MNSQNFWSQLKTPIFALAPMEDVTDTVFRELVLTLSYPQNLHLLFTEFTSVDGLCHPVGYNKVKHRLFVSDTEKVLLQQNNVKLIAQIWGKDPEKYAKVATMLQETGNFHGIDINMGCPDKSVVKQGCGSALIEDPQRAQEIILAVKEATTLPLSIKTRIGVKQVITEKWISHLLNQPIDALIVHGRIQKQMSDGLADWDEIAKAVQLRNAINSTIPILGNGDVLTISDGLLKCQQHNLNGIMVGRGIFHDPWMFGPTKQHITLQERLRVLLFHNQLYQQTWQESKNFAQLKRFFKIYVQNFNGASQLRDALMHTQNSHQVITVIHDLLNQQTS